MKNVLITGGAGFIGTKLCVKLYDLGYTITILDNLSPQIHPKEIKKSSKKIWEKCIFIEGDVCDKDIWKRAMKGQDLLIHLASETGTGQSMYELTKYNNVNIMGTANMLEYLATEDHNIKKIIFVLKIQNFIILHIYPIHNFSIFFFKKMTESI